MPKYPNLAAQMAIHELSDEKAGALIGLSRQSFRSKRLSGRFLVSECKVLCEYFKMSFDELFKE